MKKVFIILFFVVLMAGLVITCNPTYAFANEQDYVVDDLCEIYTDTYSPNGIDLYQYVNDFNYFTQNNHFDMLSTYGKGTIDKGAFFQNNCIYDSNGYVSNVTINGDDNIVNLIPKQLFMQNCEKYYIGKAYGFYIKTRNISGLSHNYSTVVLFSIEKATQNNNDFMFSINVTPIMQMDYYYLNTEDNNIYLKEDQDDFGIDYCTVKFDGCTNAVIPIIRHERYSESITGHKRHYMKYKESSDIDVSDISFGASVYNGNSLNYGDDGYTIDNDYGFFIIGNEYEFEATKISGGNANHFWDAVADTAIDAVIGFIPVVDDIYSGIGSTLTLAQEFNEATSEMEYDVTNKKYLYPNLHLYNTRQTQKQHYGNLIKASSVIIETSDEDKLYFRTNDYAEVTYLLSHTDKQGGDLEYSVLDLSIAMTIYDKKSIDGEKVFCSAAVSYDISTPTTHEANEYTNNSYYLLPNGVMCFSFTPSYCSEYVVNLNNNVDFYVNNQKISKTNGCCSFFANGGTAYSIILKNASGIVSCGSLFIDCVDVINQTLNLDKNAEYVIKYESQANGLHIFTTNNSNIVFKRYYLEGVNNFQGNIDRHEISLSAQAGDYYFILKNNLNTPTTFTITEKVVNTMPANGTISLSSNNMFELYQYTANNLGQYIFDFSCEGNIENILIHVYDEDFNNKPYTIYTENNLKSIDVYIDLNETIYFLIEKNISIMSNIINIDYSIDDYTAPVWVVSGVHLYSNESIVKRNQSISISLELSEGMLVSLKQDYLPYEMRSTCSVSNGVLDIHPHLQLNTYEITFNIAYTSYDVNGVSSLNYISKSFYLSVHAEDDLNSSLNTYNDNNGYGIEIDNNYIHHIEFSIKNGGNEYANFSTPANATSFSLYNLKNFSYGDPIIEIRITTIYYKAKSNSNVALSGYPVSNGSFGVEYATLKLNHLFSNTSKSDLSLNYIECKRHFNNLRYVSTSNRIFILLNNIDLEASESNSWVPIPSFNGTLRGNNHTISNIIINTSANSGYFGLFATNAGKIENLTADGYIIIDDKNSGQIIAGMIVGVNWSNGVVSNCQSCLPPPGNFFANTQINGNSSYIAWNFEIYSARSYSQVGGICGQNQGTISYCTNNSDMCGGGDVAGIAGTNHGGIISYCTNNRSIDYWRHYSNRCVAGITGYFNGGSINYCTNNGEIECVNLSFSNDTSVYPQIAQIIGRKVAGSNTGNICNGIVDQGELKSFDYGFLWFQTHNQAMYVSNGEIGQNG